MRYQFKILVTPNTAQLNDAGEQGFSIVGIIESRRFDPIAGDYFPAEVVYMQRAEGQANVVTETAIQNGVRDAFLTFLDMSGARPKDFK